MPPDPLLPTDHRTMPQTAAARRHSAPTRSSRRPRVVAGGALCAVAALGLWWGVERSAATPETSYVVARTRLAPGRVIEPADVALVSIRLPAEIEATVFGSDHDVIGKLVVDAVYAGELLTRGDIGPRHAAGSRDAGFAVSVELDRPQALNGLLAAGERVDVVVTDRSLTESASVVAADALVLDVDDLSGAEHLADTVTVTLHVRDRSTAVAVAAASDVGAITLIRPWGAAPLRAS